MLSLEHHSAVRDHARIQRAITYSLLAVSIETIKSDHDLRSLVRVFTAHLNTHGCEVVISSSFPPGDHS